MTVHELETIWAPRVLSIVRIVAALIFFAHGTQKLLGFPPFAPPRAAPEMLSLSWFAGVLELVGGPLLLLGLFTRPVAFILSGEMAFAYWISHYPRSFYPILNNGDAAILYCFLFLYLAVAGGGAWSLDNMLRNKGAR
jgi:putative oxidoreductase